MFQAAVIILLLVGLGMIGFMLFQQGKLHDFMRWFQDNQPGLFGMRRAEPSRKLDPMEFATSSLNEVNTSNPYPFTRQPVATTGLPARTTATY